MLWPGTAPALQPGDLDPTFGSGGSVFHQFGSGASAASQINAVAVQPDGKIVLGGFATDKNAKHAFLVARLDRDGLLDPSFGRGGTVAVQLGEDSSEVSALALQQDGKIVAAGGALIVRLNQDGSFDSGFGDDGIVRVTVGRPEDAIEPTLYALAIEPSGTIVAAGTGLFTTSNHSNDWALVVRVRGSDGSLDLSFGNGGMVFSQLGGGGSAHSELHALALQTNGKLLLGGYADQFVSGPQFLTLVRLNSADGGFDPSFGDHGIVLWRPYSDEGEAAAASALAPQPDGRTLAGGMVMGSSHPGWRALVARFHSDGRLDDAFADHGWLATQLGAGGDSALTQVNALALQPDGKIVLAGPATDSRLNNQFLVARLSGSDGGFDPAFGSDGKVLRQFGTGDSGVSEVHALALQPEGRIIAAGSADGEALIVGLLGQPPAPPPTPPVTPPNVVPGPAPISLAAVSKLRLSPVVFAAANRGGSVSRRTGTTVSYVDSVAAVTTFTVLRPARGVRSGGRCLKPGHGRHGRACTRWVAVGGFRHHDTAGRNSFHFTGRVHHRTLAPGRYRLQAIPRFRGRTGGRTTTHFRITPS